MMIRSLAAKGKAYPIPTSTEVGPNLLESKHSPFAGFRPMEGRLSRTSVEADVTLQTLDHSALGT